MSHAVDGVMSISVPELDARRAFLRRRSARVVTLLAILFVLSSADLVITLTYLGTVGMSEGNPVARWVMGMNSPMALAAYKYVFLAIGCWILYRLRHWGSSEAGAWISCGALGWLTFEWLRYANHIAAMTPYVDRMGQAVGSTWVQFTP